MAGTEKQGPLRVGQKFLKYSIREQIGRGGHAWVYHGHDPFLDHDVAIKILHRQGGVTGDMLRRGQVEAKLLFRLKHRNIVEVQDAGISDDGLLYIVMELLRGKSLREVIRARGRLPVREALTLFLDMIHGVAAAHAFGAIHRDLKPENVFMLADGSCKILDFGIAKVVDAAGMTTERDILHGTILYISPEQLEGYRATPQSDLYALGLVFFECLHGRHPLLLKGGSPTVRELSLMQIGFQPPRLHELDANIPRHVARIVERLLMKSPAKRFQSTEELGAAIIESLRRIDEDDARAATAIRTAVTERIPPGEDTEPIPLDLLPDRTDSHPIRAPGASDADVTAPSASPGELLSSAHGRPATAPPLTTPVRIARAPSNEREFWRQQRARALGAGAAVGAVLGAMYVVWRVHSPLRTTANESLANLELASASPAPAVTVRNIPPNSTSSASVTPLPSAPSSLPSAALAPKPATSAARPVANRPKTHRVTEGSLSDTPLMPGPDPEPSVRRQRDVKSSKTPHDPSSYGSRTDAEGKLWIE